MKPFRKGEEHDKNERKNQIQLIRVREVGWG